MTPGNQTGRRLGDDRLQSGRIASGVLRGCLAVAAPKFSPRDWLQRRVHVLTARIWEVPYQAFSNGRNDSKF